MSVTLLLRDLVNQRLSAAAEEIFGLVEKTITEYQHELLRSKAEVVRLKEDMERLTATKEMDLLHDRQEVQMLTVGQEMEPLAAVSCSSFPRSERAPLIAGAMSVSEDVCLSQRQPDQTFSAEDNKGRDLRSVKEERDDLCVNQQLGNTSFKAVIDHLLHSQVNRGDKLHQCSICGKQFGLKSSLINHLSVHMEGKLFFCKNCGKMVAHGSHLKNCKPPESTECPVPKPFRCLTCGKKFQTASALKVHMDIHWVRIPKPDGAV